nr:uncharacterized protein LOC112039719 [Quercus suber]
MNPVSVIVTIGGYFVDPIKKHCGYLIHYNSNIKDLEVKIQKLRDKRDGVQLEIGAAERNRQEIAPEVKTWIKKVHNILDEDVEANKMCLDGWCPRYSLSRKAMKKTLEIDGLLNDGEFAKVSHPPPPSGMKPLPVKDIKDFESRTNKMNELLEALRDDEVNMIAICVVSPDKDESKIQDEIARMLGLKLDEKDPLLERAERLKSRLMDSKSKLVILDDVWDALDLEAVGIPCGGQHNRCKILLTSRSEEACTQMKTQKIFLIKVLPEEEALNLFSEMASNCIDTPGLHPIATEVANECGGLPVAIVTIGRSLEKKSEFEWSAALQWLKKASPKNIPNLESNVYSKLKRYPDGLECPKLELLQLLHGQQTHRSSLALPGNLFQVMKGLKVLSLQGMSFPSLPQSIHVLQNLRTLLMEFCKLEDVSAIGALGKLEILSFVCSEIKELPGEIGNLSHLKLLDLTECKFLKRIPAGLLSSFSRLEELYMYRIHRNWKPLENTILAELMSLSHRFMALIIDIPDFEVLPKDILFRNQMIKFQISIGEVYHNYYFWKNEYLFENKLVLGECVVSDIAKSRMLLQLLPKSEILHLEKIKDLKNNVYELDREGFQCLKVLEVCYSDDVEYVMDATSDQNPRAAFPTLESLELRGLYHLKEIYHSQFPERSFSGINSELTCFGKLRSISLYFCRCLKIVFSLSIARVLVQLQKLQISWCYDMEECFHKEGKDEKELNDNIMFPQLTSIELGSLPRLIGFVQVGRISTDEVTNLEKHKMTDIQQHTGPFPESTPIISHKLFSSNTILWALNLENLELKEVDSLEVVFDLEGLNINNNFLRIIVLAQLKTLVVKGLSKLTYVWKNVPLGIQGFQKLTSIEVSKCHHLRYLFPTSIAKLLMELQSNKIEECDAIENIVQRDGDEEATDIILFNAYSFEWSSIKEIYLRDCPKLKTIGSEIQAQESRRKSVGSWIQDPMSKNLGPMVFFGDALSVYHIAKIMGTLSKPNDPKVGDSNNPSKIRSLFPSHIIECLKNLESIELIDVPSPEIIFQLEKLNVEESHMAKVLDQLSKLILYVLDNLMHIWKKGPERILGFGNLRLLEVSKCDNLTYLFSPSIAKLLVVLEEIRVVNCIKIEEILARTGEEEEEKDVLFYKVNSILLRYLPNLKCFCSETNALEWPSLKEIRVIECPSLSTFIPSSLNTPKLEGVSVYNSYFNEKEMCHWTGDLNATIENIFKGKEKQGNHETQQEEQIETIEKDM